MFVGVDDCFTGDTIKLAATTSLSIRNDGFSSSRQGILQISRQLNLATRYEAGRIDIDTVQRAGKVTRVSRSIVHQLCDFFDIVCVNDAMVL